VATGRQVGKPVPVSESTTFTPGAFLPDGSTLALSRNPGPVKQWDIATGKPAGRPLAASSGLIVWLALSPDGKTLATVGQDGVTQLWNVATGQLTGSISGSTGVDDATFSPDGEVLATVNGITGAVQLWDVATGQQIGDPMGGTGSEVVAFSPDGKTLAVADTDGAVQLWNVSYLTSPLAQLCGRVGGSITPAEWARYVPAGPAYRNACG
jgi:WD40 repeat protein